MLSNGTKLRSMQLTYPRKNLSTGTNSWDTLGQKVLTMWQQVHGAPQGTVSVMTAQSGLMVLIENAFSQAELALAQQSTDNLLQQYIESLARQILPELSSQVEQALGRPIETTSITSDLEQNWMMIFVKSGLSPNEIL